jgi:general secretion pathway protein F
MKELQRFLNEGREMREFLITSSIYPCIILVVTIIVSLLLFTVFIPKFAKIFVDLGKEMPLPTRIIMGISTGITDFWWLWLALFAGLVFLGLKIRKGGRCKEVWDEHILKVPVFGRLVQTIELTRFVRTLAVLIENHVHLLETIRIADRIIQNTHMQKSLTGIATELKGGTRLSKALAKSPYIPNTIVRMLGIGEETGNMGEMLENVARQYEEMVRQQVKRLLALFEPAVILILAVVVMAVVLSMFLAILEMNQL